MIRTIIACDALAPCLGVIVISYFSGGAQVEVGVHLFGLISCGLLKRGFVSDALL
jgi:hypothetical protein